MKTILHCTLIISCLFIFMIPVNAQNIAFGYDASGNRISRLQVNKELSPELPDSLVTEKAATVNNTLPGEVSFSVYPNPASDRVNIQCDGYLPEVNIEVFVFSSKAELLQSFKLNESLRRIDLQAYSSGVYFIKIRSDQKVESWKVIKQ